MMLVSSAILNTDITISQATAEWSKVYLLITNVFHPTTLHGQLDVLQL